MATAEIGMRVKSVRRGCTPQYGTVIGLDSAADFDGDRFVKVEWDHGVTCMVSERRLTAVKRDCSHRAKTAKRLGI